MTKLNFLSTAQETIFRNLKIKHRKEKFPSIRDNDITIKHCIGIHFSEARAVRAGIRNNNDD